MALVIALTTTTAVLAKYIAELGDNSATFEAPTYFFRSNVMTEEADPAPITVNGDSATVTLSNGAGADEFSDVDIVYTLRYYIYKNGVKTAVSTEADLTLTKNAFSTRTITLTPLVVDGVTYTDIMLEATATAPYSKTLRARVQFASAPYALSYARAGAVISVTVATNDDLGAFTLSWVAGISPDSADENLILNDAGVGLNSKTATLQASTAYQFKFFVTDAALLAQLENGQVQPSALVTVTH